MKTTKHHYRAVFKSDHLGSADLEEMIEEGRKLVFTITNVIQYIIDPKVKNSGVRVAGKVISANIAFFKEDIKPMALNATNSKQMACFTGSKFTDDWKNITIELYIDPNVKLKGETVGGVRIRNTRPKLEKETLTPDHVRWNAAKKALSEGGTTLAGILKSYEMSEVNQALILKKDA